MRLFLWSISVGFAVYGFLPYRKASSIDIGKANHLIVDLQECGCPCPDLVVKGFLNIPKDILSRHPNISKTELYLSGENFTVDNSEVSQSNFYVSGNVTGVDTVLCSEDQCEVVPHFNVTKWALTDYVVKAWTFPPWMFILFIIDILILIPSLAILQVIDSIRKHRLKKNFS